MVNVALRMFEKGQACLSVWFIKGLVLPVMALFVLQACSQENKPEISPRISHDNFLVLDAHLDTPLVLDRPGFDITLRHDPMHDYAQIDLPRMREGGLDGGFWVIYTPQGALTPQGYEDARAHAWHRNDLIDKMLADHADDFATAFHDTEIDLETVFYCAESVLLPDYRGRGLGHGFFDAREAQARAHGFENAAFCAVIRSDTHPAKPTTYRPLDAFWQGRGYRPLPGVVTSFHWKDLGEAEQTPKPLQFWMRSL